MVFSRILCPLNRATGLGRPIHRSGSTCLAFFIQHPRGDAHPIQGSRHKPQRSGVKQRIGIHRCLQHAGDRHLQSAGMSHRVVKRKVCLGAVTHPCLGRNHDSTCGRIRSCLDLCQRGSRISGFRRREIGTARRNTSLPCGLTHLSCEFCARCRQIKFNLMNGLGHRFDGTALGDYIRLAVAVHHLVQQGDIGLSLIDCCF